jgi:hypothetical protein
MYKAHQLDASTIKIHNCNESRYSSSSKKPKPGKPSQREWTESLANLGSAAAKQNLILSKELEATKQLLYENEIKFRLVH